MAGILKAGRFKITCLEASGYGHAHGMEYSQFCPQ